MNPRIRVTMVYGSRCWCCVSAMSYGVGSTPSDAYAAWYRNAIMLAIVR